MNPFMIHSGALIPSIYVVAWRLQYQEIEITQKKNKIRYMKYFNTKSLSPNGCISIRKISNYCTLFVYCLHENIKLNYHETICHPNL